MEYSEADGLMVFRVTKGPISEMEKVSEKTPFWVKTVRLPVSPDELTLCEKNQLSPAEAMPRLSEEALNFLTRAIQPDDDFFDSIEYFWSDDL